MKNVAIRDPRSTRGVAIVVVATIIALGGCSKSPGAPGATGAAAHLGIAANPSDFTFADSVGSAILTARALGCDMLQLGELWSTLEPTSGSIQLGNLRQTLATLSAIGLAPYFNLRVVDTNQRGVPADLAGTAWDDPALIARADAMVDTLIAVFSIQPMLAFSFGNEVDAYFGAHSGELPAFRALLQRESTRMHARVPSLRIACCTQSPMQSPTAWVGDTLNHYTDLAVYTYYPFQPAADFVHRPPATFEPDMAAMITRAGGKPIGLQEVGYSSSAVNGSSEAAQADVVGRFRRYVARAPRSQMLFASWFEMTDWSSTTLNQLFAYYGFVSPGFRGFLGGLGLRDSTGSPKPGWNAWRNP